MPEQTAASWRVVLFTDHPLVAAFYAHSLPAQGHRLVGVVTSTKRNPDYLDVIGAVPTETDVLRSEHPRRWAAMLRPLRPDLIVSNVFPLRLPQEVLDLPPLGAVNIHGGLLPQQRGTDSAQWYLREGHRETGWTMHRMTAALDAGTVLAQARFPIADDDDIATLLQKWGETIPAVMSAGLARVARGEAGEPQDESQAHYYPRIPDEVAWKSIDWAQPARAVHNVVRSSGFARDLPPGATGTIDGVPHRITKTRLIAGSTAGAAPGSLVGQDGDTLLVQCGDGPIAVVEYEQA